MTDYSFYADEYAGNSIPQCEWPTVQRDASAKVARYERIYTVTWLEPTGRDMAVCAIADAMYAFAQLQAEGGAVQSASVGSVSESRGAVSARTRRPRRRNRSSTAACACMPTFTGGADMLRYHATGPPLAYPHCTMTVTVYHTTFNPFSCRRTVLQGVYYETRRSKTVNEDGARRSSEYLLIIPQKTAARVAPGEGDGVTGTYVLQAGDRVVADVGPEISTREEWSKLCQMYMTLSPSAGWSRNSGTGSRAT